MNNILKIRLGKNQLIELKIKGYITVIRNNKYMWIKEDNNGVLKAYDMADKEWFNTKVIQ